MTSNKLVKYIFTMVAVASLSEVTFSQTTIGQSFSDLKKTGIDSSGNIVIKPGINKKLYKYSHQGISYWITLDTKRAIDFVMTNDAQFSPPEGLKIGSTFDEVLNFNGNSASLEKGWASYLRLESGWYAAFEPLDSKSNENSTLNSKIKFFFKRYDLQ